MQTFDATAVFPAVHTVLSSDALVSRVVARYDLGAVAWCRLHNRGMTDTYLVETASGRYVLRVYRAGWRTDADVHYELDALLHLHRAGVPVSHPLADRDGAFMHGVQAPEGRRQVVLFTYAPGVPNGELPRGPRSDYPYLYGRGVATIHAATDGFTSPHPRVALDLAELIDRPMESIRPLVEHRTEDWQYLVGLSRALHERAERLPLAALETGFCHGDFHGGNCHVDGDVLTFFDFDCCGPGWRAYDLAVCLWSNVVRGKPRTAARRWREFLRGYREVRPLARANLEALPLFVAARHLWIMGLHAASGRYRGYSKLGAGYFKRETHFLRAWEQRRFTRPIPRSWSASAAPP
jgi:Ser/Thr protein kinase RdoA (MazF antagonist)